jgi:hypothetical protein
MAKYLKNNSDKYIRIVTEKELIQKFFPVFNARIKGLSLICRGRIRPTERSGQYRVEINYAPWGSPVIYVLEPEIEVSTRIHTYSNGSLCLYDWREQPWQHKFHLHETIIPWIAEWLVFYELFLITGKWLGSSSMHGTEKSLEPQIADDQD